MSVVHNSLIELFKELGAFKVAPPGEPFTLASSKKSDYYVDCRKVLMVPRGIRLATYAMSGMINDWLEKQNKPAAKLYVGSIGVGGAPLLGAVLYSMGPAGKNTGFVIRDVQKDHGTKRQIEGYVGTDGHVILIDDVLTTGTSLLKATLDLQNIYGVKPNLVAILVDREEGGASAIKAATGADVVSALKVADLKTEVPATVM